MLLVLLRVRDEDKLEPPGQKGLIARWVHPFVSANAQKSRRDQSTGARLQNLGGLPSKYWHSVQSRLPPDRRRGCNYASVCTPPSVTWSGSKAS